MDSTSRNPSKTRRFLRSYLGRAFVGLILIGAIEFSQILLIWVHYHRKQRIATKIVKLRGAVMWQYFGPNWIPQSFRNRTRILHRVSGIILYGSKEEISVDLLAEIGVLLQLKLLFIGDRPTNDESLVHLKRLERLEQLQIHSSKVTDAGLEHLKGLKNLEQLWLGSTKVGDTGMKHLSELTNLNRLILDHTQVTDAGLQHLKGLTNLRDLALEVTPTTAEGRAMLQKELPKCVIRPKP